ncbi:EamA family transporter [Ktedonospora formicarum]|uniref:Membrane protein n=1 Tax=Ktedonospora formicarum TaxID=2778364 RepID=A0A8J3HZI9_9CHLR|nr:EamA family transporter [Ktedonospora formicarum]GHO42144.1 membrane protein [Ktedonospora formicarum]
MLQHERKMTVTRKIPPHVFFFVSAVFHYLGPSFAVLLFSYASVLGVAWLRIASAAIVFAVWRRPWRIFPQMPWAKQRTLLALGIVLGLMNVCFYLAIARLPLGTVGAIEFLGPIALAALGARTRRNIVALLLAIGGVWLLTDVRFSGQPLGFLFAFANCALFILYVMLGHQIAQDGDAAGIDRLGAAMLIALILITPLGLGGALAALTNPLFVLAGIGVGICSSVIPYVCDQLAMARLSQATFALLLSLLPASATVIGVVVLRQIPSVLEIAGILLVVSGIALHREAEAQPRKQGTKPQLRKRRNVAKDQ